MSRFSIHAKVDVSETFSADQFWFRIFQFWFNGAHYLNISEYLWSALIQRPKFYSWKSALTLVEKKNITYCNTYLFLWRLLQEWCSLEDFCKIIMFLARSLQDNCVAYKILARILCFFYKILASIAFAYDYKDTRSGEEHWQLALSYQLRNLGKKDWELEKLFEK